MAGRRTNQALTKANKIRSPDHLKALARQQHMRLGRTLLTGPEFIFPPRRIDRISFAELGHVFRAIGCAPGVARDAFSWHVFVDHTTNRDAKFLTPLVRFAHWNRSTEYADKRFEGWPLIDVRQHVLTDNEQHTMNGLLLELDRNLRHIDFAEGGLITDRNTPCQCYPDSDESKAQWSRFLRVCRSNHCQHIDLTLGEYGADNKTIEASVRTAVRYIQELCAASPSKLPYLEGYDENPQEAIGNYWRFRPRRPK